MKRSQEILPKEQQNPGVGEMAKACPVLASNLPRISFKVANVQVCFQRLS